MMKLAKTMRICLTGLLLAAGLVQMSGCGVPIHATDLTSQVEPQPVAGREIDETFIQAQMSFSVDLFQSSLKNAKSQNMLISPLSAHLILSMSANGADGRTLEQMQTLLGRGIPVETLNEYWCTYLRQANIGAESELKIANSIWFRGESGDIAVSKDFLQKNADYYQAQIYQAPFDAQTLQDINYWVDLYTDGKIDRILQEIKPETMMYLINALTFDAEWETPYCQEDIQNGTFCSIDGELQTVQMMHSEETNYLDDGQAVGFLKHYKDGQYSFAVLLPHEEIDIYQYVDGLTGEHLYHTLKNSRSESVVAAIPKFKAEIESPMNEMLASIGMTDALDANKADFSKLGNPSSGNLYIGEVIQKTFICVDELGTKAGAATRVDISNGSGLSDVITVTLDRPFIYLIVDQNTLSPVFIGLVTKI